MQLVLALLVAVQAAAVAPSPVPATLDQALDTLAKTLPADTVKQMRDGPERAMARYHHGLGTQLRNEWGFWRKGPLYDHFHAMGLRHPDDMSGVILTSFWRRLHGQPLLVEQQVKRYQEFWRVHLPPDAKSNLECPSGIHVTMGYDPNPTDDQPRQIHMGKCCTTGRVWSFEVELGWYLPSKSDLARWHDDPESRYDPCEEDN